MALMVRKTVIVAAVGAGQATQVFRVAKGQRVRAASLQRLTVADGGSTATWSVGDSGSATRFINAASAAGASGDLVDGTVYGYLYTAQDTISVTYTPGGGPGATAPVCAVTVEVETIWPKNQ